MPSAAFLLPAWRLVILRISYTGKSLMTILHLFKPFVERDEPGLNVQEYIMTAGALGNNSNYPTVHLIPSHQDLIFTDMDIAVFRRASAFENGDLYKSQALERILQQVKDDYDFIFIDCRLI